MTAASLAYDMRAGEAVAGAPERLTTWCVRACVLPALWRFPALAEAGLAAPVGDDVAPPPAEVVEAADPAARGWVRRGAGASGSGLRSSAITACAVTHT